MKSLSGLFTLLAKISFSSIPISGSSVESLKPTLFLTVGGFLLATPTSTELLVAKFFLRPIALAPLLCGVSIDYETP